jgi:hypothetical protein
MVSSVVLRQRDFMLASSDSQLIEVPQHVGRILIDPVRARALQLVLPVPA